jgi:hypothetical protein
METVPSLDATQRAMSDESSLKTPQNKRQDYKHALYKMWHLAYLDKRLFGQASLKLSQSDLLQICRQSKLTPEQGAYYAIPRQPKLPLSPTNTILVNKLQRRFLLALWKLTRDDEAYKDCVEGFRLGRG